MPTEEFAAPVADGSVEAEGVAQIRVAPFVEGSREADPGLDPEDCALPVLSGAREPTSVTSQLLLDSLGQEDLEK
jgi:hypothetical protein